MGEERQIRQVRSARQMPVRVQRLDDEILDVAVDKRAVGWVLFDIVCEQLNIIEKDYFGLNFINPEGVKYWLDNEKKIAKQMKGIVSLHLCFEVKFYPIDPLQMVEDITRYQLCLQIRRDIVNERVPCSTVTYALLGSFTAQSELGDFEVEDFGSGTSYLKEIQFAPKQDRDLLAQIAKLHKQHKGMTPEEAEIKFLENAEKLQFYGVEQHPAKDADGKDISLGVCAAGIIVYKDRQQVNRFVWPKILKMSYKRNKFYIKIRPGEFENFASLIGFRTVSVKMAKRLWKICVEHHSFFRFKEPESVKKYSVIPRFGSRFRYSGRTQYQSRQYVTAEDRDMPSFDRVLSKRGTFGGRTQNMRKRDEDRKRQRDQMRREPPPPPVQQDFGPPQTKLPKEYHEEPNGTRQEPKRTPPEPKHAPPVAPKPKPQIAPKPKPASRGPPSIDSASLDRGSRGSLNDSFEDVPDRRSRMEKMNAVMTPLAAVMQKSLQQNKHPEDEEVDGSHHEDDQRHHTDDEFEDERDSRPMTPEVIEQEVRVEPVQQVQAPLSAKEKKQLEKEQKEKLKKEKEMEKMRKKEEEKEKKRLEKERKALILAEKKAAKQKSKQKGQERHAPERRDSKSSKSSMDMKGDWEEAQSQEHPGSVTPDRTVKRFSSFEERKEKGVDVVDDDYDDDDDDDDEPPPPPEPLDGSLKGRQKGRRGIKKEVESASQASDYGTDEENLKEHRREQRRHGDGFDENGEVSF